MLRSVRIGTRLFALAGGMIVFMVALAIVGLRGAGAVHQRLTEAGWVLEITPPQALTLRDERRRFYRLTGDGKQALGAEVRRLEDLVRLARRSRGVPKAARH